MAEIEDVSGKLMQAIVDKASPLGKTDPEAVGRAFEADPLTLTDDDIDMLVVELRRRRNAFMAADAAKQLKKQPKEKVQTDAPDTVVAARLNKPPSELTVDDLFDD